MRCATCPKNFAVVTIRRPVFHIASRGNKTAGEQKPPSNPSPAGQRSGAQSARPPRCPPIVWQTTALAEEISHDQPFLDSPCVRPETPHHSQDHPQGSGSLPAASGNIGRSDAADGRSTLWD